MVLRSSAGATPFFAAAVAVAAALIGTAARSFGADVSAGAPPECAVSTARTWVLDLGSPDYRRRVAATRHLQQTARIEVVTAVLESAAWSDPEVAARGLRILKVHADTDEGAVRRRAQAALERLSHSGDGRLAIRARQALIDARRGLLGMIEQAGGSVEFTDGKSERIAGVLLRRCPHAGSLLRRLRRLDALERLNLESCELGDDFVDPLTELRSLRYLCLQSNPLSDATLEGIAKLDDLEALYLSSTRITDAGVAHLARLRKLRVLWLNYTGVSDESIPVLTGLSELKHLRVTGTRISDAGLKRLESALPNTKITR